MLRLLLLLLLATGFCCSPTLAKTIKEQTKTKTLADIVLKNGAIYTLNKNRSWCSAVAIKGRQIIYVGSDANKYIDSKTKVYDLKNQMVLPGFHDGHVHLLEGWLEQKNCKLDNTTSPSNFAQRLKSYAKSHPNLSWILGNGYPLPLIANNSITKTFLDKIIPDKPVFLLSQDAHSSLVNSKALEIAHINANTKDPINGHIGKAKTTGEPNGFLKESAIELVSKYIINPYNYPKAIQESQAYANSFGITAIQDANVNDERLKAYYNAAQAQQLNLHIIAALEVKPELGTNQVVALVKKRSKYSTGNLHATSAKIFADGIIENHTAALMEPYIDIKSSCGHLNYPVPYLYKLITLLEKNKFQVHVHAIGDKATHEALQSFAYAQMQNGNLHNRHIIAHLELVDSADIDKFTKLGVIANFEPFWAQKDEYVKMLTIPLELTVLKDYIQWDHLCGIKYL